MIIQEKHKRKSNTTYTSGDIQKNIDHFNKLLSGKAKNSHLDGLPNIGLQKEAEKAAKEIGTFASQSPDGSSSISCSSEAAGTGDSSVSGGLGESLKVDSVLGWYIENWK